MATYDINNLPSKFSPGDIINCPASGGEKSIVLPKGSFQLQCWGATGEAAPGGASSVHGGYSTGVLSLGAATTLYLNAGTRGVYNGASSYNGGSQVASGGNRNLCCWGGGATHIATRSGQLYTLESFKDSVIIVAGGSGGDSNNGAGGSGGGTTGGNGAGSSGYTGSGGTQSAGGASPNNDNNGSFGKGGYGQPSGSYITGGGGGGWYGGGGGDSGRVVLTNRSGGGGGGSGYVNTSKLTSTSMSNGASTNPDSTNWHGYIRITVQSVSYPHSFSATAGANITSASVSPTSAYDGDTVTFTATVQSGYVFDGWYSGTVKVSSSQSYTYTVNGSDLALTAKAVLAYTNLYVKSNGVYSRVKDVYKKINGVYVKQTDVPALFPDGIKLKRGN